MSTERKSSESTREILVLNYGTAVRRPYEPAFISVLRDYTDIIIESLDGLLLQANALGFRIHDLTGEGNPEREGILICREKEGNSVKIAFIGPTRTLKNGGVALHVHRLDKVRVQSLELRNATAWNYQYLGGRTKHSFRERGVGPD